MADIKNIINELLLELSVTYPFPNMKDREQVFALLEICDELGYSYLKPQLEEMFLNEAEEEGESKLFPGKFHLGGGFYSSKNGGEAELKNEKGNLRPVTPEEKAKFDEKSGKGEEPKPTDEPKKDEPTAEKPDDKPEETPTGDKPSAEQPEKPAPPQANPEIEQGKKDAKEDPQKVLSDPKATAQSKAMARAFKAQNDIDNANAENKPEEDNVKTKSETVSTELKNRKSEDGEDLDVETTENGSLLIGVEHGTDKESNKQTIEQIKKLPKDTKVMFVGEGGMSKDDAGNIEFGGEQDEIRNAVKGHFDNAEESSWDENADVLDDASPVFDEVAKSVGGSKSKAKAAIWSNMYGQDGPDENMAPEDYLDDEGKEWLIDQAKKGGSSEFDDDVDWNNLTDAQQKDLYELNYRDDEGYGETEISKTQEAYNGFRQKELDRKIKEAEDAGYTVIAPVGNSHVDMWRKRNKKNEFKPVEADEVSNEMPDADKEIFNSNAEALSGVQPAQLEQFNTDIDKVAKMISDAEAKGEPAPDINLCDITIPGTNLYCDDNKGIPREEMPQFKGKAVEGSRAAGMETDKDGEVDTEPIFREMLKQKNVKVLQTKVPADKLKATQKDLVGGKVIGMMGALEKDPTNPKITAPIYVSRDGYVIDGHHRWAAIVAYNAKHPEAPIEMKSTVIDMDIKDAIPMANKFAEDMGIAAKKADVKDGEAPKEEPKVTDDKVGAKATTDAGKKLYHIGNGYYSDSPNGDAKYIRVESVVNNAIEIGTKKWWNLLFEENIEATVDNGEEGVFKEIPTDDVEVATDAAKQDNSGDTEVKSLDTMLGGIEDTPGNKTTKENVQKGSAAIVKIFDVLANNPKNPHAESHKKVGELLQKMFNGEKLTQEEKDFLYQFIRIAEPTAKKPNGAKFYLAKEPNNFKGSGKNKREKVSLGGEKGGNSPVYGAFREFMENAGLSQMSTSTFGTKLTTANQTFVDAEGKTKLLKGKDGKPMASIEKDENGNVTSVVIGETKIVRLDENEPNITEDEKKLRERNNRNMDEYSKAIANDDLKFIDMDEGVSPDTPENRVIVIKGALNGIANRLKELAKKAGADDERITKIIEEMQSFAERDPNENPQQWFKDLNALMSSIANDEGDPSLKECWANYAEVYSAIVEMHDGGNGTENGACALLPESTTLETVDVITINTNGVGERKIVTLDGKSVKKGVGGASALTSKTEKSTYKDDPDGTKKEAIIELSKSHDDIYRMKLTEPMDGHVELHTNYRNSIKSKAKELGVSDEFIAGVEDSLKEPNSGWKSVNAAMEVIKAQREKQGQEFDDETMEKIRMRLESYYMYGHISHEAYNHNVDVQDFTNDSILSQSGDRGGAELVRNKDIKIDSSDGINILAYPRFEFSIGSWGNEGRSGNAGAGRLHNGPRRE